MLKDFCRVCNVFDDEFIGLRFIDGKPQVTFPRGYRQSEKDEDVRKDIIHLLTILQRFNGIKDGSGKRTNEGEILSFPILSYQYIIYNFLANGYYTEKDIEYKQSDRGKISWKRTIQKIKPVVDDGNIVYLDFITKRSITKSDIITKIHEYCVYESFSKLGWLYLNSNYVPRKPSIKFNKKMFISVLNDALKNTFNNNKKLLFSSMLEIIKQADEKADFPDSSYGVTRFEHVWENLIDYVFGVDNKNDYFPHGHYTIIKNGSITESSALEPDTIMKVGDRLFILDAKYYKYGIISNPAFLPPTSSIHKQITYGDYVFTNRFADADKIYNAFILPYEAPSKDEVLSFVSVATGDWIKYDQDTLNYKYVLVILLDTRYIMDTYSRQNMKDIDMMAEFIQDSLLSYKEKYIGAKGQ